MSAPFAMALPPAARRLLLLAAVVPFLVPGTAAASGGTGADDERAPLSLASPFLRVELAPSEPRLLFLGVDSLGQGKVGQNVLSGDPPEAAAKEAPAPHFAGARYALAPQEAWGVNVDEDRIRFTSEAPAGATAPPFVLTFDTHRCYATLLGRFDADGAISLPCVLHLPGFGTLRLSSGEARSSVGYTSGPGWIKVALPGAAPGHPRPEYTWRVTTLCPDGAQAAKDPRLDGFRRNWLNIFQLNPNRRLLSNNTNSDSCGFCYYEYGDIARATPPLADGVTALDMVRQSLDAVLGGVKTYGMPGYGDFPVESSDTFPSLLIAADDYAEGSGDRAWLAANYPALRAMAERMLATDRSGDGLIKYVATGNSGSWNEGLPRVRPSNWWDTIGFGYEDAYANALAYRALGAMQRLAGEAGSAADEGRYRDAAHRLHDAYFPSFFNPATGLVAGWRSADGHVHDYAFTFVNGIAVRYGLVPGDRAAAIMDSLWKGMEDAGYTRFRMGLPGNLVPVARRDYAHKDPRYGGGLREDNADGFQVYENGGATACFTLFAIEAFDYVGEHGRADQILLPILDAFEKREFEGTGANGRTNDWRKWDGTAEGYEGFLVDNYYVLLAAKEREDRLLGK